MTVYVVLNEDRHCGPAVATFTDREKALAHAFEIAHGYQPDDPPMSPLPDGWVFYQRLSEEGEFVAVHEGEVR